MDPTARTKLLENIQNDLKNISLETKKSKNLQQIRESTDEAIVKIRSLAQSSSGSGQSSSNAHPNPGDKNDINIFNAINQILYPLVQGCETKDVKVVRLCLGLMQRLIVHKVLDFKGKKNCSFFQASGIASIATETVSHPIHPSPKGASSSDRYLE